MKTKFSYFLGMFENPAPAVKTSCIVSLILLKKEKYFVGISILNECVEKLWDDYRL